MIRTSAPIPAEDQPLAFVLELPGLTGLDFTQGTAVQATSQHAFNTWFQEWGRRGNAMVQHYAARIAAAKTDEQAVIALARLVQGRRLAVAQMARIEIPSDVRAGASAKDKIEAFCDALRARVVPLLGPVQEAVTNCASRAAPLATRGWWNDVCVPASSLSLLTRQ